MTIATILPQPRTVFLDANSNPLSGGLVYCYQPNTTTGKTTWQDAAGVTPNANPIVLDGNGSALLYGSGAYTLTVNDSLGNLVYTGLTQDVYGFITAGNNTYTGTNTFSATVAFLSTVSLGGSATATTQSPGDNTTKVATDAFVTTAVGSAAGFPQEFRLTLTSGTPVTTANVTGATTVYCTPYIGNRIALFDGVATWATITSVEFSLAVGTLTSGRPYDVFCYNNSGVATLEFTAWTNDTTRATALAYQNGILVKSGATTRRYLGSFYTTATTTTEDSVLNRYLWNYYNRVTRPMYFQDGTANWTYTTATWRQAHANAAALLNFIIGVTEDAVNFSYNITVSNSSGDIAYNGIGIDSITAPISTSIVAGGQQNAYTVNTAIYNQYPSNGKHYAAALEISQAAGTSTWYSTGAFGGGPSVIQGGLIGTVRG